MCRKYRSILAVAVVTFSTYLLAATAAEEEKPAPQAPWSVSYRDGSGNGYRFWKVSKKESARFAYSPVQPKNSSTGLYSGGKPKKGTLDVKRAGQLWQRVRRLEKDASLRIENREKGTGAFILREPATRERTFIIKRGSSVADFDLFLKPFRAE